MKISRLILFLLGIAGLPGFAAGAATRTLTMSTPAAVAPGASFTVPCSASTDQGSNGEQVAYFYAAYSLDNGASWTAFCYDATTGTTVSRTIPITAGASGSTIVVRIMSVFRGSPAGDVDFTGGAMNWSGWNNWDAPPAKYASILVNNAASAQVIVPNITYNAGQPVVVSSSSTLATGNGTINSTVTISPGATVIFQAGTSIDLKPGFHAANGANFHAEIGATQQAPVMVASSNNSIIAGQSVTFTATGGLGATNYVWGGSASGTGPSQTVTFNTAGTYTVTVTNTGSNGLAQTSTITVTVYANSSSGFTDPGLKILVPTP